MMQMGLKKFNYRLVESATFAAYRHTPFWIVEDVFIGSREVNRCEMRKSVDFNVELPIRAASDDDAFLHVRSGDFKNVSCPCGKLHLLINGRHEIGPKTLQPGDVLTMVIPPPWRTRDRDSK